MWPNGSACVCMWVGESVPGNLLTQIPASVFCEQAVWIDLALSCL